VLAGGMRLEFGLGVARATRRGFSLPKSGCRHPARRDRPRADVGAAPRGLPPIDYRGLATQGASPNIRTAFDAQAIGRRVTSPLRDAPGVARGDSDLDRQHRAGSKLDHALRGRTEQGQVEGAATAHAHDDQVRLGLLLRPPDAWFRRRFPARPRNHSPDRRSPAGGWTTRGRTSAPASRGGPSCCPAAQPGGIAHAVVASASNPSCASSRPPAFRVLPSLGAAGGYRYRWFGKQKVPEVWAGRSRLGRRDSCSVVVLRSVLGCGSAVCQGQHDRGSSDTGCRRVADPARAADFIPCGYDCRFVTSSFFRTWRSEC